jgi:hypothetical protein
MDVEVNVWLRDGYIWDFCCDEDDAILLGLVSALPGAAAGANLPADGVIQIEARTGERLFLSRSSLVAVRVLPITDKLPLLAADRFLNSSYSAVGQAVGHQETQAGISKISFSDSRQEPPLIDFAVTFGFKALSRPCRDRVGMVAAVISYVELTQLCGGQGNCRSAESAAA